MSDIIRYDDDFDLAAVVERDGYFVIPGFYDTAAIEALRARLGALLDADEAKRDTGKLPVNINDGGVLSDYTEFMHNLVFPSFVDELFAETVMATLDQPAIAKMMRSVVGPRYRMRADLVRRATGKNDASDAIQLPHEWHRDLPGEFTFGFFLDDFSAPDSGGTAVIPGTQWSKYNPIWDFMLGPRAYTTRDEYLRGNSEPIPEERRLAGAANLQLRNRIGDLAVELRGKPGDLFFFLNDTFHGRWPNKSGKRLMLVRFGGISSAFPFKDDLPTPQPRHSLREIADRFAPRQEVAQTDEILLCRLRSRPRSDAVEEAAAEEKRKVVAELLEERARRVAAPPPEVHVPGRRSIARSLFARARRAIGL